MLLLWTTLLLLLAPDPAGPLPPDLSPQAALRMDAGDILRMYKRSLRDPARPYRSLVIVRRDGTVRVRTLIHGARFLLSDGQRSDLDDAVRTFDLRRFTRAPRKSKRPPSAEGDVDYFVTLRRGGRVVSWTNTQYDFPGPDPLFDCLEVYEYLGRPEEKAEPSDSPPAGDAAAAATKSAAPARAQPDRIAGPAPAGAASR